MLDINMPPYSDDVCHYFTPTDSRNQLCLIDEARAWSSADASAHSQASIDKGLGFASRIRSELRAGERKQKR
jgi:hypothetical protein